MILRRYNISGIHKTTKRRRKIIVEEFSNSDAILTAISRGLTEPLEITEEPPEPPSEKQLKYASDLGAIVPLNASKDDLSIIIPKKLDRDSDPNPGLIDYANHHKLIFSEYIGKRALYNRVYGSLPTKDRAAFFIFSIYRWLTDDRRSNLEIHPHRQIFFDFALQVLDNEKIITSINRYSGDNIRFFGKIIQSNGKEILGGSTNTIAYKAACEYLETTLKISTNKKIHRFKNDNPKGNKTDNVLQKTVGCLVLIVVLFFIFVFIIIVWALLASLFK